MYNALGLNKIRSYWKSKLHVGLLVFKWTISNCMRTYVITTIENMQI